MSEYRVALDVYNGPLDLLLYLIRREEIEIYDIPIARVTAQYIQYVEMLRELDPESVSEFLVLAATLMEIKSRMLLPTPPPEEGEEESADPRMELVRQLLEYKKYKDAARHLEGAAEAQAQRHARFPVTPPAPTDEIPLESVDIWDLFEAFNRLLEQIGQRGAVHKVTVDDTPLALHAEDIVDAMQRSGGSIPFDSIFTGRTRAEMIGLFLALLELIRQKRIRASQDRPFEPILIHLLDATPLDIDEAAAAFSARQETPADPQSSPSADFEEADGPSADVETRGDGASDGNRSPTARGGASALELHPIEDDTTGMGTIEPAILDPLGTSDSDQPKPTGV